MLEKDNITLASKCKQLRENYEQLTCEYNDQQSELANSEKNNLLLVGNMDQMRLERDKATQADKMLRTELEKLHVENEKLAKKEQDFERRAEQAREENARLKERLAAGGDAEGLREELEGSRQENASLKAQHNKMLARLDREQEELVQQLQVSREELRVARMEAGKEKENLQQKCSESEKEKFLLDKKVFKFCLGLI